MTELFSLGDLYVSDFLADGEQPRAEPADLTLVMDDDTGVVHLRSQPPPQLMWGRYWYRSGTNATMRAELYDIVQQVQGLVSLEVSDVWVDIASNDGTLLSHVYDLDSDITGIGVDPVEGEIHERSKMWGRIVQEPFTSDVARRLLVSHGEAKVVTCIAMFYDLLDPTDFLAGVHDLLADDGVFVLQMSYTPLMLEQLAFDNICHEHARYYTLNTLASVLSEAGLAVVDVELNDTNGGSFRVIVQRADASRGLRTQPWRDVAYMRVLALLDHENRRGYNDLAAWERFSNRLLQLRADVVSCVERIRAAGGTIWGYGASTKGNTLLQFFGLDHTHIDAIAERQESKFGLRTVGTNIPIKSEAEMREAKPDYLLMLPWHFVSEFCEREADYLEQGGRFIVPCPRFEIIGDGPPAMAFGDGRKPA